MNFSKTTLNGTIEILASKDFTAIPVDVTKSEGYNDETYVPAGTPLIFADDFYPGAGILLYDVYPEQNPNAALLVQGVVNVKKMAEHMGTDLATLKSALEEIASDTPGIIYRYNVGAAEEAEADENLGE